MRVEREVERGLEEVLAKANTNLSKMPISERLKEWEILYGSAPDTSSFKFNPKDTPAVAFNPEDPNTLFGITVSYDKNSNKIEPLNIGILNNESFKAAQEKSIKDIKDLGANLYEGAKLADITGVLHWEDYTKAQEEFEKSPNAQTSLNLILCASAVIPGYGIASRPAKAAKAAQVAQTNVKNLTKDTMKDITKEIAKLSNAEVSLKQGPVAILANKLHSVWLDDYHKNFSGPKYKPVPDKELDGLDIESFRGKRIPKWEVVPNSPPDETIEKITSLRLKDGKTIDVNHLNLYDCQLTKPNPDSKAVINQNIAQEPALINPQLMDKLNGKIAGKYLDELSPKISQIDNKNLKDFEEELSEEVHNIWVRENKDWAPKELQVAYKELPEIEKQKDRNVVGAILKSLNQYKELEKAHEIVLKEKDTLIKFFPDPKNPKNPKNPQSRDKWGKGGPLTEIY